MKKKRDITIIILLALFAAASFIPSGKNTESVVKQIILPQGFNIGIFAPDLGSSFLNIPGPNSGPRMMAFYKDTLFASIPGKGIIVALPDRNNDGKADEEVKVMENLNRPHGIGFLDGYIYIANENSVVKAKIKDDLTADAGTMEYLTALPEGGHWTRTLRIKDGKFYISIGSSCNACMEKYESRGTILQCNASWKCRIYAGGLRNAVGMTFDKDGKMYATENGRDLLGEDLPPDEINLIEDGSHYGWPYCYGKNILDKDVGASGCEGRTASFADLQAHSAPLGLAFSYSSNFPKAYNGSLFVAYHGSWNRKIPTGYKIVRIDMATKKTQDFAVGWLTPENKVIGRPVDIIFDNKGVMYVTDDNNGNIYRIWYGG